MNLKKLMSFTLMLTILNVFSQDISLSTLLIDKSLTENANAVIRNHEIVVDLDDFDDMIIKEKRIITIFNKNGLPHLDAYVSYDPDLRVKSIAAKVYNKLGEEIDSYKKKDFDDYSNSGISLFSDNRILNLDYTPTEYPFTFEFEHELHTNSTAFFPRWYALEGYFLSTQKSSYKILNSNNIPLQVIEYNFDNINNGVITNKSENNLIHFEATNIRAYKWEYMVPSLSKISPIVMVAPKKFNLINVEGSAENWTDFGRWNFYNLLSGRSDLSESTKNEIASLVKGIDDPIEKAKKIYNYVKDKTRNISMQLRVGGWQPMLASQVDEVSYGDCKALTNYTKALMESQGIEAN